MPVPMTLSNNRHLNVESVLLSGSGLDLDGAEPRVRQDFWQ